MKRCAVSSRLSAAAKPSAESGRHSLIGRDGDRSNTVVAAGGENFTLLSGVRRSGLPVPSPLVVKTRQMLPGADLCGGIAPRQSNPSVDM
jgi:hypothetical protein